MGVIELLSYLTYAFPTRWNLAHSLIFEAFRLGPDSCSTQWAQIKPDPVLSTSICSIPTLTCVQDTNNRPDSRMTHWKNSIPNVRLYLEKIPTSSRLQTKNSVWYYTDNSWEICIVLWERILLLQILVSKGLVW